MPDKNRKTIDAVFSRVGADVTALRSKGSARTRDDEKQFEALQAFELELIELRDSLPLSPAGKILKRAIDRDPLIAAVDEYRAAKAAARG